RGGARLRHVAGSAGRPRLLAAACQHAAQQRGRRRMAFGWRARTVRQRKEGGEQGIGGARWPGRRSPAPEAARRRAYRGAGPWRSAMGGGSARRKRNRGEEKKEGTGEGLTGGSGLRGPADSRRRR